jgi:hypothetical protein
MYYQFDALPVRLGQISLLFQWHTSVISEHGVSRGGWVWRGVPRAADGSSL